jgi:prepilin-type N-terminal cleavage/methylation domain-containing protein
MKRQKGFTLIELEIVLGIILIIAAIAIPTAIGAKIRADETSAIAAIKTIETAQASYETAYPAQGFASSLAALGGPDSCTPSPENACLIDEVLTDGTKSGYVFTVTSNNPAHGANTTYVAAAAPISYNRTGARRFCATEKNVIRWDANTAGSTTLPTPEECAHFQPTRQ